MRPFLALPPIRAEPREVELAQGFADMFFGAAGPEGAETLFVMGAWGEFAGGVDVQVEAFVAVAAVEGPGELVAFGHAASVLGRHVCQQAQAYSL